MFLEVASYSELRRESMDADVGIEPTICELTNVIAIYLQNIGRDTKT